MNDEINSLKLNIFELQSEIAVLAVRLRAFENFFALFLEQDFGKDRNGLRPVLELMETDLANDHLASLADENAMIASITKKLFSKHFSKLQESDQSDE